jgi:hypothetical protein
VENFDLFRVPDGLPFGVLILDGESRDLVEWAATTYETHRAESQRVETIPDLNG